MSTSPLSPLTRANLRALSRGSHDNTSAATGGPSASPSASGFDYMHTQPLPGYQAPAVYNFFQLPQPQISSSLSVAQSHTKKTRRRNNDLVHLSPLPLTQHVVAVDSPLPHHHQALPLPLSHHVAAGEDDTASLSEQHRGRLVQNVITYIRFFCGQVNHAYSLADVEDLIANPVVFAVDIVEKNKTIWELLDYIQTCCKAAAIKPMQWFDILTNWKAKFQRSLTFTEFSVGVVRLMEEVNAQAIADWEIELLFLYFLRSHDPDTNLTSVIRRRDFQVGWKKQSLSSKRIEWFNHQAHILFKCQHFLSKLNLTFKDLNVEVVRSKYKKKTVNVMELGSMVSVLVSDYITFVNCKHVDKLLKKEEIVKTKKLKRDKASLERFREEQKKKKEEKHKRRILEGSDGSIEIYDDLEDDDIVSVLSDGSASGSITSQLDLPDDLSTISVMDDMSESSTPSNTNKSVAGSKSYSKQKLEPLNFKLLERNPSEDEIKIPKTLSPEELMQVQSLVNRLHPNIQGEVAAKLSAIMEQKPTSDFDMANTDSYNSFMEERQKRSSTLIRTSSMMRRYSKLTTGSGDALEDPMNTISEQGGASPNIKNIANNLKKKNGGSFDATAPAAGGRNESIIPKEVINDWYLRDESYKIALEKDPSLTPNTFKEEYQAFENTMKDKRQKQMNNYKSITDHFDLRITQARKRLARARKTGI